MSKGLVPWGSFVIRDVSGTPDDEKTLEKVMADYAEWKILHASDLQKIDETIASVYVSCNVAVVNLVSLQNAVLRRLQTGKTEAECMATDKALAERIDEVLSTARYDRKRGRGGCRRRTDAELAFFLENGKDAEPLPIVAK